MPVKFKVIRDTREQEGNGWFWRASCRCAGTETRKLATGDYTIEGYESRIIIERKADAAELAKNAFQKRFGRELERLEDFEFPFIIVEATLDEIVEYPKGSSVPWSRRRRLRVRGPQLLRRLCEWQMRFRTRILFAGASGKAIATSLFKRMVEHSSGARQ